MKRFFLCLKQHGIAALLTIFSFISAHLVQAQTSTTYTSSTTWTCPVGVSSVTVQAWGGGGAGGGAASVYGAGGGGGGGAYVSKTVAVTPGTVYTITIGAGGTGVSGAAGGAGGLSWFGAASTVSAAGGSGGGASTATGTNGTGATGGTTAASIGTTLFAGGNGATGANSNVSTSVGGGGGGSAGTASNGNNATAATGAGGAAVTGGGAGANGTATNADGVAATTLGGGGAGAKTGSGAGPKIGGAGFRGQLILNYTQLTYLSQLVGFSLGSTNWCAGETRNVTIQIKNIGTATWSDVGQDINVGVKWNQNGTNWTDYYIRTDAQALAPGATGTFVLPITASNNIGAGYTTPLAAGTNNLIFDVVYEGVSWFGDNGGGVGPGNVKFTSPNQTIVSPTITLGTGPSICQGTTTASLPYTATTGSPNLYSIDFDAAANTAGLADVNNTALPASAISLTIPAGIATGTYNGTVTVTNSSLSCPGTTTSSFTVTVNGASTLALTSAAATTSQTPCINTPITTITYLIGGGGTGATVSGLPTGVTGVYASGTKIFTISGTPTLAGPFNYTVITTGPCANPSLAGTMTVRANSAITLTSAAATTAQTTCLNSAITNITYSVGGTGTGGSVSGLPSGVNGVYSGGVITISGAPSAAGTFSYTATATGPCANASLTGTISVNTLPTAVSVTPATATTCIGNTVALAAAATINTTGIALSDNFNGTPTFTGSGTVAGGNSQIFTKETSGADLNSFGTFTSPNGGSFMAAAGGAQCGFSSCTSSANTALTSGVINTTGYSSLNLSYNHTYKQANVSGSGVVEISTNGTTWTTLKTFTTNQGGATSFVADNITISNSYLNQTALRLRFTFVSSGSSGFLGSHSAWWVIDDVLLNGQLLPFYSWSANTAAGINGLPAGASTASLANSNITVNPTATTIYTLTAINPASNCTNATATSTVTVNQNSTIGLSSAAGTNAQTICTGAAIANITYAIGGGGTGASITAGALPSGVTGSFSGGVFTISGTPSAIGTFNYTVTTAGPCVNNSLSGTITIRANSTISLSSAAGTNAQTICIGSAITNITYAIGGGGTGGSITAGALPSGVTGSFSGGVFAISGTPSAIGTFNYTVTTAGPCVNNSLSGTITVRANSTISLSSAAGTNAQTICIGSAITTITYAIGGGGTGASITAGALPSGVTGSYSAGVFTLNGTPTASGTFNYTVTTTGPCVNNALSGTITVNANSTIGLSSPAGTDGQTICIGSAITNITYAIGGGGTGAAITGGALPSGVSGSFTGGVFTLNGTPTATGTFNYTITTTGPCVNNSLNGTITVNTNSTIILSSATGSDAQTVCVGNAIVNINYGIGGSATGASITGGALPAGVSGSFSAGLFTLNGTPTATGTFNYTVTTTGPCVNNSLSGTITVNENSAISLSSPAGSDAQTLCVGNAINTITYTIGGSATGASVTGGALPPGVTGSLNAGVFTLNGTPATAGTFNYTVTTSGPCVNNSSSGTITVNGNSTLALSSAAGTNAQTICLNSSISDISYTVGGTATGASITAGALPNGVTGSYSGGVFTISGTATQSGTFDYTVTTSGNCGNVSLSGEIIVYVISAPVGSNQTVCADGDPEQTLTATATGGTITWYDAATGGNVVSSPILTGVGTVTYYAQASGSCTTSTRTAITLTINASPVTPVAGGNQIVCSNGDPNQTLIATATSNDTVIWYDAASGGNAITPALIGIGSVTYYAEASGGSCTSPGRAAVTLTINPVLATPATITGPLDVCPLVNSTTPSTYSVPAVQGATSYTWLVPAATTVVSGQGTNSIQVTFNNAYGQVNQRFYVSAQAANACSSASSVLEVLKIIPDIPTVINGPADVCPYIGAGTNAVYSITPVAHATSYTWNINGNGTIISGQGTTSIAVSFLSTFTFGNIQVTANSNCGNRAPRSLTVSKLVPNSPASISGPAEACSYIGTTAQATYSITAVPNATSYVWTVPANVNLISGQGTTSINVTFSSGYSTAAIKVKSVSACSSSSDRLLSVVAAVAGTPGLISGPSNACSFIGTSNTATYVIRPVLNATGYLWSMPAGASIVSHPSGSGITDTIITVAFTNAFVAGSVISVQAVACVPGTARTLAISRIVPATPGIITGVTNVCPYMISSGNPSGTPVPYSIRAVMNATNYSWTVPAGMTVVHPNGAGVNDTIIQVTFTSSFTTGSIGVSASSDCGTSAVKTLVLSKLIPGTPGAVTIVQTGSCPNRQVTYSIPMPTNTTSVIWTVPGQGTILSGQGTTTIVVAYSNAVVTGTLTVTPSNNCANGSTRSINISLPACSGFAPGLKSAIAINDGMEMKVNVSPNPAISDFKVQVVTSKPGAITMRVIDLQGKEFSRINPRPNETIQFGSNLKAGVYLLEVRQGDVVKTTRLVKF